MGIIEEMKNQIERLSQEIIDLKKTIGIMERNHSFDMKRVFEEIDNLAKGTDENGIERNSGINE